MTKISLGSKNPSKIQALKNVLKTYEIFQDIEIIGIDVKTGVSEQPMSLEETLRGSKNRAKNAFIKNQTKYSFGIESGFMKIPDSKNGYLEFTACTIYDGTKYHIGFSPGFECPNDIMTHIINDNLDLVQASNIAKYSSDPELGKKQGIVGILTKNKITRTQYTSYAIIMAMIHIDKVKK